MKDFNACEIIGRKNSSEKLSQDEISFMVAGMLDGKINDFQTGAFVSSLYHKGMDEDEIFHLTQSMASHGEKLDLSSIGAPKLDKHSTGGVGDGVTLMLAPLAASLGIVMPTMAGRSLGCTGGTIDKIEAVPGLKTALKPEEITKQLLKTGCAIFSQSSSMAPADKKIYAVRDQISCVDSPGLITASILSKKIAEGIEGLLLDLKVGSGAFMKDFQGAKEFAGIFCSTAKRLGLKTVVFITDMDQPLGKYIGNILEIKQACEILSGKEDPLYSDIRTLVTEFAGEMLVMAGIAHDMQSARQKVQEAITGGKAFEKFKQMTAAQKGDTGYLDGSKKFPEPKNITEIKSLQEGYIKKVNAGKIAECLMKIGALGGPECDCSAGVVFEKKYGDFVRENDTLGYMYHRFEDFDAKAVQAKNIFLDAYEYTGGRIKETNLIKEIFNNE